MKTSTEQLIEKLNELKARQAARLALKVAIEETLRAVCADRVMSAPMRRGGASGHCTQTG